MAVPPGREEAEDARDRLVTVLTDAAADAEGRRTEWMILLGEGEVGT